MWFGKGVKDVFLPTTPLQLGLVTIFGGFVITAPSWSLYYFLTSVRSDICGKGAFTYFSPLARGSLKFYSWPALRKPSGSTVLSLTSDLDWYKSPLHKYPGAENKTLSMLPFFSFIVVKLRGCIATLPSSSLFAIHTTHKELMEKHLRIFFGK